MLRRLEQRSCCILRSKTISINEARKQGCDIKRCKACNKLEIASIPMGAFMSGEITFTNSGQWLPLLTKDRKVGKNPLSKIFLCEYCLKHHFVCGGMSEGKTAKGKRIDAMRVAK